MSANSKIEWTHHTFNPWWGCVKVSPACDHCYAERDSIRYGFSEAGAHFPIWGKGTQRRFFSEKHWAEPLKWDRAAAKAGERQRVFCASMADVMEDNPDVHPARARLYNLIDDTPNLDWLLTTKRPQNFRRYLPPEWITNPRRNVWGLTTVESPEYLWRIDELLKIPFAVRGVSAEPLLGQIDLELDRFVLGTGGERRHDLSWVIVGGESGPGARPMHPDWARSLRDQCVAAGVPFFFKQWGEWSPNKFEFIGNPRGERRAIHLHASSDHTHIGHPMRPVGKKAAGRLLDGREWNEMPEARR